MKLNICNATTEAIKSTAVFIENLLIPAMNDDKTFISCNIATHYLAEIDHCIEIFWNIVIRPVFKVQVSNTSFFIFL